MQHYAAGKLVAGHTLANSVLLMVGLSWLRFCFLSDLSAGLRWTYSESLVGAPKG